MLLLLASLLLASSIQGTPIENQGENLLIILVDGVRWDYVKEDEVELKGFKRLEENGVTAEYVNPVFPPNSYPNWYSIATGLFPESHGMVQNIMYDEKYKDYFLMSPHENVSHTHWWNQTEPLWITAEKAGIKAKMVFWDGCQVKIHDTSVEYCEPYKDIKDWLSVYNDTLDSIVQILSDFKEKKYRLAMVYFEPVDSTGHKFGPNSDERKEALKNFDKILDDVQDKMQELDLEDKMNLVIVSDHGMTETGENVKSIDIESFIDSDDIEMMLGSGSLSMILPEESKVKTVYNSLVSAKIQGLQVFLKEDIPEHFHFKGNRLVLPILLLADEGYSIKSLNDSLRMIPPPSSKSSKGGHGYDPFKVADMRTVFFARGPRMKKEFVSPPINMVDHYNLFCHLLNLRCMPNNGSLSHVNELMSKSPTSMGNIWLLIAAYSLVRYFFPLM